MNVYFFSTKIRIKCDVRVNIEYYIIQTRHAILVSVINLNQYLPKIITCILKQTL